MTPLPVDMLMVSVSGSKGFPSRSRVPAATSTTSSPR